MLLTPSDARETFVEALSSANRLIHVLPASLASLSIARTVGLAHTMIQRSEGLRGTLGPGWGVGRGGGGFAVNQSRDVALAFYSDLSHRFGDCPH